MAPFAIAESPLKDKTYYFTDGHDGKRKKQQTDRKLPTVSFSRKQLFHHLLSTPILQSTAAPDPTASRYQRFLRLLRLTSPLSFKPLLSQQFLTHRCSATNRIARGTLSSLFFYPHPPLAIILPAALPNYFFDLLPLHLPCYPTSFSALPSSAQPTKKQTPPTPADRTGDPPQNAKRPRLLPRSPFRLSRNASYYYLLKTLFLITTVPARAMRATTATIATVIRASPVWWLPPALLASSFLLLSSGILISTSFSIGSTFLSPHLRHVKVFSPSSVVVGALVITPASQSCPRASTLSPFCVASHLEHLYVV